MKQEYYKYPRTRHLPWTQHKTTDDKIWTPQEVDKMFIGTEVVVTEKLDGENTSLYQDHYHARSVNGRDHASRHWVKKLWGNIKGDIPDNWRICGENVYAEHSIKYKNLPSYFLVFNIWNERNVCLSWGDTKEFADILGLHTVPELYLGEWDEKKVKDCYTGKSVFEGSADVQTGEEAQEGYVVRYSSVSLYPDKNENSQRMLKGTAKFVREGHVTTSEHWMSKEVVPNELKENVNV